MFIMADMMEKTRRLASSYVEGASTTIKVNLDPYTYENMRMDQIDALLKYIRELTRQALWLWEWTYE